MFIHVFKDYQSDDTEKCRVPQPADGRRRNSAMRVKNFFDANLQFMGRHLQGMSSKYVVVKYEDGLSSVDEIRYFVNESLGAEAVVGEILILLEKITK